LILADGGTEKQTDMKVITRLSKSVVSLVLISGNLSVLSKKGYFHKLLDTIKYFLYCFTRILKFTDVCIYGCAVEKLCTASLSVT